MSDVPAIDIRRALYGKLAGDGGAGGLLSMLFVRPPGAGQSIYYDTAPEGAGFPFVMFSKQSGVPTYSFAPKRTTGTPPKVKRLAPAFDTEVWLFKAIDRDTNDADAVERIRARIEVILADDPLTLPTNPGTTGTPLAVRRVLWLRRQSDQDYEEIRDGVRYKHAGSLYRLIHEETLGPPPPQP